MSRSAIVLLVVMGALTSCGPESPVPFVYCDEDAMFPEITESVSAGGLANIDATEVTQGQYQRFLDATASGTDVSDQPSYCSWNTTYAVDTECLLIGLADERMLDDVQACDSRPVTCVDFCDAYMYCEWAGKHLCGSVDGGRLPLDRARTMESEWYIGCSAGGQHTYGPGDVDDGRAKCNTLACFDTMSCAFPEDLVSRTGTPVAPGSMPDCQSPQASYTGVFDTTGNVMEWDNSCDGETGSMDECATRGGWYGSEGRPCDETLGLPRSDTFPGLGFRCCGDPADP